MSANLIITHKRSNWWYIAIFSLLLAALFGCFLGGQYYAVTHAAQMQHEIEWLNNQVAEYQQALNKANEELIRQDQTSKVDSESTAELVNSIKELKDSNRQLLEELTFYRNIMAPELSQEGLTIADLLLSRADKADEVYFKLALTQVGKHDLYLKGDVRIKISGLFENKPQEIDIRQLGSFAAKDLEFQFRYFQNIEGVIKLPDGFVAQKIAVTASTSGLAKNQTAEKQFEWNL